MSGGYRVLGRDRCHEKDEDEDRLGGWFHRSSVSLLAQENDQREGDPTLCDRLEAEVAETSVVSVDKVEKVKVTRLLDADLLRSLPRKPLALSLTYGSSTLLLFDCLWVRNLGAEGHPRERRGRGEVV